jgi:hypothetical protein
MTRALSIFTAIQDRGIAAIDEFIQSQTTEDLFLDFKCVKTANNALKLIDDDKKNLGKAISGFGNSDGGIVVWGIDCRMVPGVGDVPSSYQADAPGPLKAFTPVWFKSLLEGLTSGATLPAHQGVRHFSLDRPGKGDGVVVSYIPAGLSVPYRCIADKKDVYYIRSGSDFLPAPHGVLAALFGQRPQPLIELECKISPTEPGEGPVEDHPLWVNLQVTLKNAGRGMAEDLFVLFEVAKTPFSCKHNPFDSEQWQVDTDQSDLWGGPTMAVTKPSKLRLPPGGKVSFTLLMMEKTKLCEFSMAITAGSPGGPSVAHHLFVDRANIEEACAIYSETKPVDRRNKHVTDAIRGKLT